MGRASAQGRLPSLITLSNCRSRRALLIHQESFGGTTPHDHDRTTTVAIYFLCGREHNTDKGLATQVPSIAGHTRKSLGSQHELLLRHEEHSASAAGAKAMTYHREAADGHVVSYFRHCSNVLEIFCLVVGVTWAAPQ